MGTLKKYIKNVALARDQLINAVTGGDPDESISSRAGKALLKDKLWAKFLCKFLNIFERDHCLKAIEKDEGKDAILDE